MDKDKEKSEDDLNVLAHKIVKEATKEKSKPEKNKEPKNKK